MCTKVDIPSLSKLSINSSNTESSGHSRDEFQEFFAEILTSVETLVSANKHREGEKDLQEWLKIITKYNVPDGKQIRGRLVVTAYHEIVENAADDELKLARVLGWVGEILQAACLVADDIMDNGITRRGKPCWYRVNDQGNIAFNDSFLLEHIAYQLLRKYFGDSEIYRELLDLLLDVTFKTILGQALDTRVGKLASYEKYTEPIYDSIVIYKTAYYTVYLPVAFAMVLAGISSRKQENVETWKMVEEITLKIGKLFQVQDDYFDCFADEMVLGKTGTDIQEGKCTWLFVTGRKLCSDEEYNVLKGHYGSLDARNVAVVKKLYEKLDLPAVMEAYQENLSNEVTALIKDIENERIQFILYAAMTAIYKRKC